jgi:hypothetical protein
MLAEWAGLRVPAAWVANERLAGVTGNTGVVFNRTDTLAEPALANAISGKSSPFSSLMATE